MKMRSLDISGMGGSYEEGCQRILWLGLEWIKDKPLECWKGTFSYKNIAGIMVVGDGIKELDEILKKDAMLDLGGMTGAMRQFSLRHLHKIHDAGYHWWLEEGREMDRIIETEQEVSPSLLAWLDIHKGSEFTPNSEELK